MNRQRLVLICGIPGTGKTTMGEFLRKHHGFIHLDAEFFARTNPGPANFVWEQFLGVVQSHKRTGESVVITWGFIPGVDDETIRSLQEMGFVLVWFDGDRVAARHAFLARGDVSEELFDIQMARIDNLDLASFKPVYLNPFHNGKFRDRGEIAKELLRSGSDT
jgi:hypothetical protein